jgi:hypothetical protein
MLTQWLMQQVWAVTLNLAIEKALPGNKIIDRGISLQF